MNAKEKKKKPGRTETKMLVNFQVLQLKSPFFPSLYFLYFLNFSSKDELFIRKKMFIFVEEKGTLMNICY